jgi:hypothetical protein
MSLYGSGRTRPERGSLKTTRMNTLPPDSALPITAEPRSMPAPAEGVADPPPSVPPASSRPSSPPDGRASLLDLRARQAAMALDIEAINRVRILMGDSMPPPPEPRPSMAVAAAKRTGELSSKWASIVVKAIGIVAVVLPVLAQFFPKYGKVFTALVAAMGAPAPP